MGKDVLFGIIIILGGLGFITYLVLWSRKTIEHIAGKKLTSVREIVKELNNGR